MCAEVLSMMEQLLTVGEKRDAEALALQRAGLQIQRKKQIGQDAKTELADVAHEIDKLGRWPISLRNPATFDKLVAGMRMLRTISERGQCMGVGGTMWIDSHLTANALPVKSKTDRIKGLDINQQEPDGRAYQ
ncbi:hypothetical protein GQ607_017275 [Colletotrichum asianum]|uniref:Uncharacterized protein n=1 Tax=Colletotrichum asianum TaxID=702518 RepID=A0A8H3VS54_9PEZI|nr:hypothetical protein GQ607_017275 [Colletotrichum asianum]